MWTKRNPLWGGAESHRFYSRVCVQMIRATKREMYEVKQELASHLQDHAEALMERGYDPDQAELRAVETMGDPVEIGRTLNESYSRFWLILKRTLIALFCVLLLPGIGRDIWSNFADNMLARLPSQIDLTQMSRRGIWYADQVFELEESRPLNLTMESDSTVVHLEQVAVGKYTDGPEDEGYCVAFSARIYPRNPFERNRASLKLYLADDPDRARLKRTLDGLSVGGRSGTCFAYQVDYGTEQIEIAWERYGQDLSVQAPLNWEGVP